MEAGNVIRQGLEAQGYRTKTIGGTAYSIKLMPAYSAFSIGLRLVKALLPAFGALADSERREGMVLPEDDMLFTELAAHLVGGLDKIPVIETIQVMFNDMLVDGKSIDPDNYFRGKISDLVGVLEFALKENFSDFFTGYLREKGLSLQSIVGKLQDTTQMTLLEG